MSAFSNKRKASPDDSSNKKNKSDSKPEKTEYRQLPEIVFSIGNWDLLVQTINDTETRLLYRNRKERINRFSSPYEDFVKKNKHNIVKFKKVILDE